MGSASRPPARPPEFYRSKGLKYPPAYGPLAAVTPGTPGGLMLMLAEYGTLSLGEVLQPAIELADGYPIDAETANNIERWKDEAEANGRTRSTVMLPHPGDAREAPQAGEIFRQPDLAATLRKLVEAESSSAQARASRARKRSAPRTSASTAATSRRSSCAACRNKAGSSRAEDLAKWKPMDRGAAHDATTAASTSTSSTSGRRGPALLQSLNILENFDLRALGYNSAQLHPHASTRR